MEHYFNVDMAREYGIEEAILFHHFYYWIVRNVANGEHFHDGLCWAYNSKKAFAEFFPYMNEAKILRVIKHMEDEGLIIKGHYNSDERDKANWYAITRKGLELLSVYGYNMKPFSPLLQDEQSIKNNKENNKEEDANVSPERNDYLAVIACWNEHNGKRLGSVTKITERRKRAIKKVLEDNEIDQEQLMRLFKTLPFADSWLYHPNKQHANWKPDFDWWMANTNGWLTKALEGKVHKENPQAFASIMQRDSEQTTYTPQGRTIWFNEGTKSYWTTDNFYYETISDGYDDDTRPDGATLTLNNARGDIKWNKKTKKWGKV